jgi:hypothetical protein
MNNPQVNAALKRIGTATTTLAKQFEVLERYSYEKLEAVMNEIETGNEKLKGLDQEYAERKRAAMIQLELDLQESRNKACEAYAKDNNHRYVSNEEWNRMVSELQGLRESFDEALFEERAAIRKELQIEAKLNSNETQITISRYETQNAELKERNLFLVDQVERLRNDLTRAQETVVQVAQANSSTVNVGNSK